MVQNQPEGSREQILIDFLADDFQDDKSNDYRQTLK
jgi:hypothetical protein